MANYSLIAGLETIWQQKAAAKAQVDATNAARLAAAPAAIRAVLPRDVSYDEDAANWTLLADPVTGIVNGVELRLFLTDGTHEAPIPLPGYVKVAEAGVQLFLGSDPLPLTKLADWGRETPLRSVSAAYERLLELQEGGL